MSEKSRQEYYIATLEIKLSLLHGCVDVFYRHMEDHLSLTQIKDLTAIWMEIQ